MLDLILAVKAPEPILIFETETQTQKTEQVQEKPEPITYTAKRGDNLTKIARKFDSTWQRLFDKNLDIDHPDHLVVGSVVVIPDADEVLKKRTYKLPPQVKKAVRRAVIGSNTYQYGQCTYGVKMWKPEVPNNLGNANMWKANLIRQGWSHSLSPVVGAVAWTGRGYYGHVALVLGVDGDQVLVREMNYDWNGSVREKWVHQSTYEYLY